MHCQKLRAMASLIATAKQTFVAARQVVNNIGSQLKGGWLMCFSAKKLL